MLCRCCGRHTMHGQAGQASRCIRPFWTETGAQVIEVLCWRCFTWSDVSSPAFGKLYATR